MIDGNYFIWIRVLILMIPISIFFTISKYKLLDTNIRIKKNIQYVFASLIAQVSTLAILLILLIWISQLNISFPNLTISGTNIEVLNTALSPESQQWYQKIFLIIITILFSIIGWKARIRILRFLDKKFHRVRFDYRKATSELAEILSKYLTIRELTTTIVREIADLAMLKKSGLIVFRNEETIAAHDYYGVNSSELYDLLSSSGITLVQSIKSFKESFRVEYLPEPHKEILRAFGFVQVLPIYSKNKLLGAALIGEKKAESSLNRADIEFLNTFSGQLAVAIDNSFMYEECTLQERIMHELEIARRIQLASLPDSIPNIEGLDISGTSIPAYEVGGDFYDFLESDNGDFMMIIGDVSGKGTSAALYMSKIQGVIRTLHEFGLSPRQLLIRSNNILAKYIEKGYFISATIINFETSKRKAQFARAGHLPVYSYSNKNSELKRIISKGMVLGLTRDKLFERNLEEEELNYDSGDILVFVTDGITESKNSMMVEFGEDRLIETIKANAKHTAEEIRNQIMKNSREFASNEPQFDDMTVVVIKIP
jgi:serine phosphatase RsbU (regulator of sigma subunit)